MQTFRRCKLPCPPILACSPHCPLCSFFVHFIILSHRFCWGFICSSVWQPLCIAPRIYVNNMKCSICCRGNPHSPPSRQGKPQPQYCCSTERADKAQNCAVALSYQMGACVKQSIHKSLNCNGLRASAVGLGCGYGPKWLICRGVYLAQYQTLVWYVRN